jgi:hypothetical protein
MVSTHSMDLVRKHNFPIWDGNVTSCSQTTLTAAAIPACFWTRLSCIMRKLEITFVLRWEMCFVVQSIFIVAPIQINSTKIPNQCATNQEVNSGNVWRIYMVILSRLPEMKKKYFLVLPPFNFLKHQQFNFQQLKALPHTAFTCFVFIWEQTATFAPYKIHWSVFITEMKSVYSAVRTGYLNKALWAAKLEV